MQSMQEMQSMYETQHFLHGRTDVTQEVIEKWKMIVTEKEIQVAVRYCANIIEKKFHKKKVMIVCVLKGAANFFNDLTRNLTIPHTWAFIKASSYHNSQTQSEELKIEGSLEPSDYKDTDVILVDELFDNGLTLDQLKNAMHAKAKVPLDRIHTCTVFRKEKNSNYCQPNICALTLPDIWLVGYGLDDQQEKRNWTFLFACPKSEGVTKTKDDDIFIDTIAYQEMRQKVTQQLIDMSDPTPCSACYGTKKSQCNSCSGGKVRCHQNCNSGYVYQTIPKTNYATNTTTYVQEQIPCHGGCNNGMINCIYCHGSGKVMCQCCR